MRTGETEPSKQVANGHVLRFCDGAKIRLHTATRHHPSLADLAGIMIGLQKIGIKLSPLAGVGFIHAATNS
jgi:hypothetical protein